MRTSYRINLRFWFLMLLLFIAVLGLIARMLQLSIFERHFLLTESNARVLRDIKIPATRGMITDRFGDPLAISTPVASIWLNPKMFKPTAQQLTALSKLLSLPVNVIQQKMKNKKREFVYLKRRISPNVGEQIKTLDIPGVFIQREYRRYYPEGEVIAHLIGFTNVDDSGQEGLELEFNKWLRGVPGKSRVVKDRLGHIIAKVDIIKEPREGHNLVLSIDHRIQFLAYRELKREVAKTHADAGSIVVLDARDGEILAIANVPSYNPNHRPKNTDGRYRNRALTDLFEPGSTLKAFSVASALISGEYTPDTIVDTNPGWIKIGKYTIREVKRKNYGEIPVKTVLQKSSNIGVARMMLSLPSKNLWDVLARVGFGVRTHSGFPGEASGVLSNYRRWSKVEIATMAYGYGVSITALQLAHAFSVFATGGINIPVTFLKQNQRAEGVRVMPVKVSDEMMIMLEKVLRPGGTASRVRVPGYLVAGKTGTAYMLSPNGGYDKKKHVSSFVGIAPVSNPRLVIAVVIFNPKGKAHYGGQVAGPVFSAVMSGALRMMDIQPDSLS